MFLLTRKYWLLQKKKTCKLDTEIPGSPSPTFMAYWNFFPISSRKLRTYNKSDNIFLIYNFKTEIEILKSNWTGPRCSRNDDSWDFNSIGGTVKVATPVRDLQGNEISKSPQKLIWSFPACLCWPLGWARLSERRRHAIIPHSFIMLLNDFLILIR